MYPKEINELQNSLDEKIHLVRELLTNNINNTRNIKIEEPVSKILAQTELEGKLIYNIHNNEKNDQLVDLYVDYENNKNKEKERIYLESDNIYVDPDNIGTISPSMVEYMIGISEFDKFLGDCLLRGLLTQEDVNKCKSYNLDNKSVSLNNFIELVAQNVVNLRRSTNYTDLRIYSEEKMWNMLKDILGENYKGRRTVDEITNNNIKSVVKNNNNFEINLENKKIEIIKNKDDTFRIID